MSLAAAVTPFVAGIGISQIGAYAVLATIGSTSDDRPMVFYFFGLAGVVFGGVGGYFAYLLFHGRIRRIQIVYAFGAFELLLLSLHRNPNYAFMARCFAVIAALQLPVVLLVGMMLERAAPGIAKAASSRRTQ